MGSAPRREYRDAACYPDDHAIATLRLRLVDGLVGGVHTFEEVGGKAKVTSTGHMGSVEALERALSTGMVAGGLETWDRLAALLAEG